MSVSDQDLIRDACQGSASAFEQLVTRYDERVLAMAYRYVGSRDDAKDIYQEVFVRVHRALRNFRMESEFATWLYRITANVCLTHRAAHRRRLETTGSGADDDVLGSLHSTEVSAEERMHAAEISESVTRAMQRLSPQQKLVFTLRHYQGHKLREIASMMECTEGTVKRYLFAATQRMREELKELVHQ